MAKATKKVSAKKAEDMLDAMEAKEVREASTTKTSKASSGAAAATSAMWEAPLEFTQRFRIEYKIPDTKNMGFSADYMLTVKEYHDPTSGEISRHTLSWQHLTSSGSHNGRAIVHLPLWMFAIAVEEYSFVRDFFAGRYDQETEERLAKEGTRAKYRYQISDKKPDGSKGLMRLQLAVKDVDESKFQFVVINDQGTVSKNGSLDLRSWQRLMHPTEQNLKKCIKGNNDAIEKILDAVDFTRSEEFDVSCIRGYEVKKQEKTTNVEDDDEWLS